jgi:hypothetical protein
MLLASKPTLRCWLLGIPLVVIGELIRFWSAGHLRKNEGVITSGPYGYVRNPLYVGSFFIFCGLCIMTNRWEAGVVFMAVFIAFHAGAASHEEQFLMETFGDDYAQYCRRVPRLIPRLISRGGAGKYSMVLALHNREHKSALCTLFLVLLFGIYAVSIQAGSFKELVGVIQQVVG